MYSETLVLLFAGEVFGIPVTLLVLVIILAVTSASAEREKSLKEGAEVWKGIRPGMSKDQVAAKLGRPQQIVPGTPETWVYTYKNLTGSVTFKDDVVVGYENPR